MTELRRFNVKSATWLTFRTSLFIALIIAGIISVLALAFSFLLSESQSTLGRFGEGAMAVLIVFLVMALIVGGITLFGFLQPLIYNAIARFIGGFLFTLKPRKKLYGITHVDVRRYMKWYAVCILVMLIIVVPFIALAAYFSPDEAFAETGPLLAFTHSWPFAAAFSVYMLVNIVIGLCAVLLTLRVFNRYASRMPLEISLSKAKGASKLERLGATWIWWLAVFYVLQMVVNGVFTLIGVLPNSGEGFFFELIMWLVLTIITGLIGLVGGLITVGLYNWGAKRYGPVVIELR